jgi:hypothetical protein
MTRKAQSEAKRLLSDISGRARLTLMGVLACSLLVFGFILLLQTPAQAGLTSLNGSNSCMTSGCHAGTSTTGTIATAVNGTAGTSITVAAGSNFEVDWIYSILGSKSSVGPEIIVPSGWTVAAGTLNSPGLTNWDTTYNSWDLANGVGWSQNCNATGDGYPNTTCYSIDFINSVWDAGSRNTAYDNGSTTNPGDRDRVANQMGTDAIITVPAGTAPGTYSVTVEGIGHDGNSRTHVERVITVTVSSGGTTPQSPAVSVTGPSSITYPNTGQITYTGGQGSGAMSYALVAGSTGCTVNTGSGVITVTNASGTCQVTATKAGDSTYAASTSGNYTVTLNKATQATLSVAGPASVTYGSTGTLTSSGGSGTGAVTYSAGASTGCNITGGTTLNVSDVSGTCSVTATKATDSNYLVATSASYSVILNKATQATLSVAGPASVTYGSTGTLTSSGGSGSGAVTYSAGASTGCNITGGTTLNVSNASGTCSVTATKAADTNYLVATSASYSVTLNKAPQATLSVTAPASVTYGSTGTLTSAGGSGSGAVTYSAGASTGCNITGGTTLNVSNASGTCSVTATKATDNNYLVATSAGYSVILNKATQATLSVAGPASVTYGSTGTLTSSGGSGSGAVTYSAGASTGCNITGGTTLNVSDASGTCSVTATKATDNNYLIATSAGYSVTLNKATQATLSVAGPASVTYGSTGTLTSSGGSGSGAVTYSAGASTGCNITGGTTLNVSDVSGTCSITATKAADTNYFIANSAGYSVTLNKATQATLTVTAPASVTFGSTGTLTSSGGSGSGAVTYSAGASTGCNITGGTTLNVSDASGTCSVTATKAADTNYLAATSAGYTVSLNKAAQATLTVTAPASVTYGSTGTLTSSGGSGSGAVTYSAGASTGCNITGGTTLNVSDASGTCSVTATKATDNNYLVATSAGYTVTLNKADQATLSVAGPASVTYGSTGTLTSSGGSGTGAVTYSAGASTGCNITGGTTLNVSDVSGTCSVTATKAADTNYNIATSAGYSVTLNKAEQATLSVAGPASVTYGSTGTLTSSGGSGTGEVTYSAGASTGCNITGGTTLNVSDASGTCAITATKAADTNYNIATSAGYTVTLNKAPQTISFGTLTDKNVGDPDYAPGATASSTLTVTYASSNTAVATIVSGNIHIVGVGTTDITASQAGNTNYNAAADVIQPLNVNSGSSTFTLTVATNGGTGSGTVNSNPTGPIACPGDCTETYTSGTEVTLMASATSPALFTGWNGAGCTGNGNCVFNITADTTVTAIFDLPQLVMLPGPVYYASIQTAYNAAAADAVIKLRDQTFIENLVFDSANVTFDGGYEETWTNATGFTTINGDVTIAAGGVTISNMIVQ